MVVDDGQQLVLPTSQPLFSGIGLALWAMAVTTRIEGDGLVTALIALVTVPAQGSGTAADNSTEHFDLWPGQCPPVPLPELAPCHANDVGHLKGWPPHEG